MKFVQTDGEFEACKLHANSFFCPSMCDMQEQTPACNSSREAVNSKHTMRMHVFVELVARDRM